MDLVTEALGDAAQLIVGRDPELLRIAALSLAVSGLAAALAGLLGVPIGAALHLSRWPGRRPLVLAVNTGMGLPPVVVGLAVTLLLWRTGPLGSLRPDGQRQPGTRGPSPGGELVQMLRRVGPRTDTGPADAPEVLADSPATSPQPPGLLDLAKYFLWIGATGFGGPVALVGYMHRDLVERRKWFDDDTYRLALAFSQLMPGPLAVQLAATLSYFQAGVAGASLSLLALVLPSLLLVLVLSVLYVALGVLWWMQALFYGVGAASIAIIPWLRSAWRPARSDANCCRGRSSSCWWPSPRSRGRSWAYSSCSVACWSSWRRPHRPGSSAGSAAQALSSPCCWCLCWRPNRRHFPRRLTVAGLYCCRSCCFSPRQAHSPSVVAWPRSRSWNRASCATSAGCLSSSFSMRCR